MNRLASHCLETEHARIPGRAVIFLWTADAQGSTAGCCRRRLDRCISPPARRSQDGRRSMAAAWTLSRLEGSASHFLGIGTGPLRISGERTGWVARPIAQRLGVPEDRVTTLKTMKRIRAITVVAPPRRRRVSLIPGPGPVLLRRQPAGLGLRSGPCGRQQSGCHLFGSLRRPGCRSPRSIQAWIRTSSSPSWSIGATEMARIAPSIQPVQSPLPRFSPTL